MSSWTSITPVRLNTAASAAGSLVYYDGTGACIKCGDTVTRQPTAIPTFTTMADLGTYLQSDLVQNADITAANPVAVKLTSVNMNAAAIWTAAVTGLYSTLNAAGARKHVALDLSACTGDTPSDAATLRGSVDQGQQWIVSLVLPDSFKAAIPAGIVK